MLKHFLQKNNAFVVVAETDIKKCKRYHQIKKMEINLILHKKYLHDIYIKYIYLAILFGF